MPALPSFLIEPLWAQFSGLLPSQEPFHPLIGHRPRIADRVVFDKLVQVLVFGAASGRVADRSCSATTLRRRRDEWMQLGVVAQLEAQVRAGYDRLIGLELEDLAVDGCITKTPCGGELSGPSPVDRAKQGMKRSTVVDAKGIPLGSVLATANTHDSPLLAATLDTVDRRWLPETGTVHLDRGYNFRVTRERLATRNLIGEIARRGRPTPPYRVGQRWVVERTNAWHNAFKKLVWHRAKGRRRRLLHRPRQRRDHRPPAHPRSLGATAGRAARPAVHERTHHLLAQALSKVGPPAGARHICPRTWSRGARSSPTPGRGTRASGHSATSTSPTASAPPRHAEMTPQSCYPASIGSPPWPSDGRSALTRARSR